MPVLALVKDIEIVGEAVARVSEDVQRSHPDIPWSDIIGMRHRLIHAYFEINLDILWETVTLIVQIPALSRPRGRGNPAARTVPGMSARQSTSRWYETIAYYHQCPD